MILVPERPVKFWHVQDIIFVVKGAPVLLSPKFKTSCLLRAAEGT